MPDLQTFPSAQAQDHVPIKGNASPPAKTRKSSAMVWFWRGFLTIIMLGVLGAGTLALLLSRGSISHEQLRANIESQFSRMLGNQYNARIGGAKIAFGSNGFIAVDASNVQFFENDEINLGMAKDVAIKVKAMPLLRGEVIAESVVVNGASISLSRFLPELDSTERKPWPKAINFVAGFTAMGELITQLARSVEDAGLESITLNDTQLLGFDQLNFRSPQARLVQLKIEKDINFTTGISFSLVVETVHNNWSFAGQWRQSEQGGRTLFLNAEGLTLSDLLGGRPNSEQTVSKMDSPVKMRFAAPFNADGTPQQATLSIELGDGRLDMQGQPVSHILGGKLNFRFFPEKNQIELERSPVRFETTQAVFLGGIRYPLKVPSGVSERPVFQLIAQDLQAYGMTTGKPKLLAALNFDGWIDAENRTLNATTLSLRTQGGAIEGEGNVSFAGNAPHLKANLSIPKMALTDFKQFWPQILAPGARKWAREGINGGEIRDAKIKLDFPPGVIGNDASYTPENISATIPVYGSTVKTVGDLPDLRKVEGVVNLSGKKTLISLSKAYLSMGARGSIDVGNSTLRLGDYTKPKTTAELQLALSGKTSAMAQLGTLEPLKFTKALNLIPTDLSGSMHANVKSSFVLEDVEEKGVNSWKASVKLSNAGSRRPINGRVISDADLTIEASNEGAKVSGKVRIDGVPAKLALVEQFGKKSESQRTVKLTLTDAARKRMGADTGAVLTGPVEVELTTLKNGDEKIVANLKNARLNLPWIGWSKGKGIAAKASFVLKRQKGRTVLQDFKLSGNGFSANGRMEFNSSGVVIAKMKNVRLNKTDDFDIDLSKTKGGYSVAVNARSYDGRAIIQSFLNSERTQPKGKISVTVKGRISRLTGFGGQALSEVEFNLVQKGKRVSRASVRAMAKGNAPTVFSLTPVAGGLQSEISTSNAGSVLRFLNLYTKIRGGTLNTLLVRDDSQIFRGDVTASNFTLLGEPRLAKLLSKPQVTNDFRNEEEIIAKLRTIKTDNVKIDNLLMNVEKGRGFLNINRGRLTGGDASAAFSGRVYDKNNRMNIKGTYLPGRALNRFVSKIPLIGLAFGKGKVNGLLGITFKLTGVYGNPRISVNPLSIIAPGVFRQIFKF